jgi:hypothetical protein
MHVRDKCILLGVTPASPLRTGAIKERREPPPLTPSGAAAAPLVLPPRATEPEDDGRRDGEPPESHVLLKTGTAIGGRGAVTAPRGATRASRALSDGWSHARSP